jgi:hypothetical protein
MFVNQSNSKKMYVFLDIKGGEETRRNCHSQEVIEDCIPDLKIEVKYHLK